MRLRHVREEPAATLRAGKDFPRNILLAPINTTIISVCEPAQKKTNIKKRTSLVTRSDSRRVVAQNNNSVVTQSDRRFTRGGRGNAAGKLLSKYVQVCWGGRIAVARSEGTTALSREVTDSPLLSREATQRCHTE